MPKVFFLFNKFISVLISSESKTSKINNENTSMITTNIYVNYIVIFFHITFFQTAFLYMVKRLKVMRRTRLTISKKKSLILWIFLIIADYLWLRTIIKIIH